MVVALEEHDGRLVGAGGLGQRARARDEDEARHGRCVVADVLGEDLEPLVAGRDGRADAGVEHDVARLPQRRGARGRRQGGDVLGLGQVPAHPTAHLGPCVRVGADGADLGERHPGRAHRTKVIGTSTSPMTTSGSPVARESRVAETPPSTEFSIGTIAASMSPARSAESAASTEPNGRWSRPSAASQASSAIWVNVPRGPR